MVVEWWPFSGTCKCGWGRPTHTTITFTDILSYRLNWARGGWMKVLMKPWQIQLWTNLQAAAGKSTRQSGGEEGGGGQAQIIIRQCGGCVLRITALTIHSSLHLLQGSDIWASRPHAWMGKYSGQKNLPQLLKEVVFELVVFIFHYWLRNSFRVDRALDEEQMIYVKKKNKKRKTFKMFKCVKAFYVLGPRKIKEIKHARFFFNWCTKIWIF